ncbi:MAG: hypothetical protein H6622_15485 [Halobacteriovoraceae bacterium]|nr:hypothetical protein [Halobacteriovoraceae bacterium]
MSLKFIPAETDQDLQLIYDHNIDAFTDTPDFDWSLKDIKNEIKDGWSLFSVIEGEEIIAAVFYKKDGKKLLTKNTSIKSNHQGSGHSHSIKEFFETKASELNLPTVIHYCRIDNFRMCSLNERHGYSKQPIKSGHNKMIIEWVKDLTKENTSLRKK